MLITLRRIGKYFKKPIRENGSLIYNMDDGPGIPTVGLLLLGKRGLPPPLDFPVHFSYRFYMRHH